RLDLRVAVRGPAGGALDDELATAVGRGGIEVDRPGGSATNGVGDLGKRNLATVIEGPVLEHFGGQGGTREEGAKQQSGEAKAIHVGKDGANFMPCQAKPDRSCATRR